MSAGSPHTPAPTPSRAIYGLSLFLGCRALLGLYLCWALLPSGWPGLELLPARYWAVALPVLVCVGLAATAFLVYPALGLSLAPAPHEAAAFTDRGPPLRRADKRSFPSQRFVASAEVCQALYLGTPS